jgi:hypothetical protein
MRARMAASSAFDFSGSAQAHWKKEHILKK